MVSSVSSYALPAQKEDRRPDVSSIAKAIHIPTKAHPLVDAQNQASPTAMIHWLGNAHRHRVLDIPTRLELRTNTMVKAPPDFQKHLPLASLGPQCDNLGSLLKNP